MVLDGGTWDDEIQRWADDPDRFTQVAYTSICQRIDSGRRTKTDQVIYKTTDSPRPEYAHAWDTLILDEAHMIKGRDTHWTKALRKIAARSDRVILMSGTPMPNWAHEIFTSLQFLYPGDSHPGERFGSYWRWAKQWFDCAPTKYSQGNLVAGDLLACTKPCFERPPIDPCEHYKLFHRANFGDLFLQRLRDDVLTDLPPLTVQTVECPMVPAQQKAYRELKKEFVALLGDGTELIAWNSAALNVKLLKVCTGLEIVSDGAVSGSGKLARLQYDLSNRSRPTVVFAHFQSSVEAACAVAGSIGARAAHIHGGTPSRERQRIVAAFKAGELDVLCGSLETLSEGLTLVQADMAIMLEASYKPSRNIQAMRRIHRLGQTRPVVILDYVTPRTVDAKVRKRLAVKTDRQMRHQTAAQFAELL
jgi:SNF2 family DNA or RNA helicase